MSAQHDYDTFPPEVGDDGEPVPETMASMAQVEYLRQLFEELAQHDWSRLERFRASDLLTLVNRMRKVAGISFKPFSGVSV